MNRKKIELILLTILIAVHIFCNFIWINSNSNALIFQGKSWQKNINIYSVLKNNLADFSQSNNNETSVDKIYKLIVIDEYSPPFYFWIAVLVNLVLAGILPQAMLFTSSLFFVFLIIIVYKMSEYLSKGSGIFSAFICSLYPFIYLNSRFFNMALAVGVMVTLSVYVLLKTRMFESRAHSILLGVCLGIGMLTKYTFFVFLIGPMLATMLELIRNRSKNLHWYYRRNNMLVSLFIGALISGTYYFNSEVIYLLFIRGINLDYGIADMTILERFMYYLNALITKEIGIVTAVYTLGLSILFFKTKFVNKKIMGFWIFLSFILVAITPKYDPQAEYIIPILPALAIISGIVISSIKRNLIKYSIAISLCLIMLVQFFQPYNPDKPFCFSKGASEIKALFHSLGKGKSRIGYICPNSERDEFLGIKTFLSLWSDNKAAVVDFLLPLQMVNTDMNKFDFLVNVYSDQRDRLGKDFLTEFEELDSFYFSPKQDVRGPYLKINVFKNKRTKESTEGQLISNQMFSN